MTARKPLLEVRNGAGHNILPALDGLWIDVRVTDKAGEESDDARILCVGPPSLVAIPKRGDRYEILMGWEDEGLVLQGAFTFQKARCSGSPERGETIALQFRAADFVDKLKTVGREHFDDTTFGDLMKRVAAAAGLDAVVDPELAKVKLGYRVRWDQSAIDFATEVGREVGATVKPAGGKLLAMKKGSGKSGRGQTLAPILIRRGECAGYDIAIDPRPEVGKASAGHQDGKTGRRKLATRTANREGAGTVLPHPYASEDAAEAAAGAEDYAANDASGSGSFEMAGLPFARAEAPVIASGFGPPIDGTWKAESIEKTVTKRGGFLTTVNVTAGADKKGEKGK